MKVDRRAWTKAAFATLGAGATSAYATPERPVAAPPLDRVQGPMKVTRLETFLVKPRWLFLKIHTDAGITGLGEPITEGRALTCKQAVEEIAPYLIGKDPRAVVHHWQAIYRHAFYRGGPILTSALSGIDQALWDIKGKALGVPVYELLGGPTRNRVRVYAQARTPETVKAAIRQGFTAFKTGPAKLDDKWAKFVESPAYVANVAEKFAELRAVAGARADIAIDFHGAISPATAKLLIKALEPHQPMFVEEPVQCQNVDAMVEIAREHAHPHRHRRAHLHQVGVPRDPGEEGGDHPPARPLPRGRHHRGAPHRGDGRGLLRDDRTPQPPGADLARRGDPDRGLHSRTSSARSR